MGYALTDALFGGGGPDYADVALRQEEARQKRVRQGTKAIDDAFSGFTPDFYNQRGQAYIDYAMPQLSQQYNQARNQIGFGLANRGLLGSSAAGGQFSALEDTMATAKQGAVDTGIAQSQDLQKQIDAAKNQQLSFVYQGADPSQAGAAAVSTAASFAQPSTFAPVANAFTSLLNQYYYSQLINNYRPTSFISSDINPSGVNTNALGPVTIGGQ